MRILVTGAAGAIGRALVPALEQAGHRVFPTDIDNMDVTSSGDVWNVVAQTAPEAIVHLAASKLAVEGELNPVGFTRTNILGTFNIIEAAKARQAKLIFSSTCKAADPETVYGACKLVAERAVLSAGGTVVRFFNVLECGPSVKTIWEQIPAPAPIPYTDCWRYFISVDRAVAMLELALTLPPGRYAPNPGLARHMRHVAAELYPGRELVEIPRRRGDRQREPLHAACEYATGSDLLRIVGAHDPEQAWTEVAAFKHHPRFDNALGRVGLNREQALRLSDSELMRFSGIGRRTVEFLRDGEPSAVVREDWDPETDPDWEAFEPDEGAA